MSEEMTLEERKVIYRARRGLKELDVYYNQAMTNNSDGDGDGGNADVKEQFEQEALKEAEME